MFEERERQETVSLLTVANRQSGTSNVIPLPGGGTTQSTVIVAWQQALLESLSVTSMPYPAPLAATRSQPNASVLLLQQSCGKRLSYMISITPQVLGLSSDRSSAEGESDAAKPNSQKSPRGVPECFPEKFMRMLEETKTNGLTSVVSFELDGKSFAGRQPHRFIEDVAPNYVRHDNLQSFKRQMHHYMFQLESAMDGTLVSSHPNFQRGVCHLLRVIQRSNSVTKSDAKE